MAEGWARHLHGNILNVYSAGTDPHGVDPRAVKVMFEAGVDISSQISIHLDEYLNIPFDLIVTVCDSVKESCTLFPGEGKKNHRSFEDPPFLAREANSEEEVLAPYRRVRDEIGDFVAHLIDLL